jgi:hypothetical protein
MAREKKSQSQENILDSVLSNLSNEIQSIMES